MTDNQAKQTWIIRAAAITGTTLIYMETPHSNGVFIGVVPFTFTDGRPSDRDPGFQIIRGHRALTFEGRRYQVNGWGPTDSLKQRAIIGPYND